MSKSKRRCSILLLSLAILLTGCASSVTTRTNVSIPARPDSEIYSPGLDLAANTIATTSELETTAEPTLTPTPSSTPTPTPTPSPTPTVKKIVCSFIGDCTFGQNAGTEANSTSFQSVIGTDYKYPFQNAKEILLKDHLTLANLEGTLTDVNTPREKEFIFKGSKDFVNILTLGGVEAVNLSNNHSYDYWDKGLQDTKDTLDEAGVLWSDNDEYAIYEVEGVKIGMAGFNFPWDLEPIYKAIDDLRAQGCSIVIISVHTGVERMYEPEMSDVRMAHAIIDYGADIYVGHHPHRLQPIEEYNGKYILYSLSNFSFGGQPYLSDRDTAIVQCTFSVDFGQMVGVELNVIPYSMTTTYPGNDYCPIAYKKGTQEYDRVMQKLRLADPLSPYDPLNLRLTPTAVPTSAPTAVPTEPTTAQTSETSYESVPNQTTEAPQHSQI